MSLLSTHHNNNDNSRSSRLKWRRGTCSRNHSRWMMTRTTITIVLLFFWTIVSSSSRSDMRLVVCAWMMVTSRSTPVSSSSIGKGFQSLISYSTLNKMNVRTCNVKRRQNHGPCSSRLVRLASANNDEEEGDLFDVFDPRISPHMYPGGIPSTNAKGGSSKMNNDEAAALKAESRSTQQQQDKNAVPIRASMNDNDDDVDSSSNSSKDSINDDISSLNSSSSNNKGKEGDQNGDLFDVFDPRISPHMYPSGIPSADNSSTNASGGNNAALTASQDELIERMVSSTTSAAYNQNNKVLNNKIGILLIDHGSKRDASNKYIEEVAREYSQDSRYCPPHFIIEASHMEIAKPSIEDGIRTLIGKGAYQIVCFPFFLGPGKHATEDVPQLIDEAKRNIRDDPFLQQHDIQIIMSPSFSSKPSLLIDVMSRIINDTIRTPHVFDVSDETYNNNSNKRPMGFFGEIQRLVEEEL